MKRCTALLLCGLLLGCPENTEAPTDLDAPDVSEDVPAPLPDTPPPATDEAAGSETSLTLLDVPTMPDPPAGLSIVVDGLTEDWADVPFAADGLKIANDDDRLLILFDAGEVIALDESAQSPLLLIDADSDNETGPPSGDWGIEVFWSFGQRGGSVYSAESPGGDSVIAGQLGLFTLPTVSSRWFEVVLARSSEAGPRLDGTLRIELGGQRVEYALDTHRSTPPDPIPTEVAPQSLRVVTWNMLQDGLLDPTRAEAFRTVLTSLRPDVIAFQEVFSSAEAVRQRIAAILEHPDGADWYGRGYQGRVVVSRYPLTEGWPENFDALHERFQVVGIELPRGPRFVLINGHMTCCSNDSARMAEADSFATWVADLVTPGGDVDAPPGVPFALVGDLNLVGSHLPLDRLLEAPDWSGGTLVDLVSRHADAPVSYTWRSQDSDFWPGRLDFVLYAADTLTPVRHFVGPDSPAAVAASDHLPHVVDFRILPNPIQGAGGP